MYCEWMHEEIECLRLFKVMTTDDGFCCVFNAIEAKELLHEESAYVAAQSSGHKCVQAAMNDCSLELYPKTIRSWTTTST